MGTTNAKDIKAKTTKPHGPMDKGIFIARSS
jgi:hypothetical protein